MKKTLLVCLMLSVAFCLYAGGSGEKKGKAVEEIVVAVPALPATLDPGDNSNQTIAMYKVFMNMYDTLIKIDYRNNTGTEPGLAESWKRIDDTTMELYLRKGAKFHDGSEFSADDVLTLFGPRRPFSKDSIMGKDKNFPNFKEVQKIDDYTVRIITKKPEPTLEQILSLPSYSIISGKAFNAQDYKEWQFKPIGTGPYKIVDFADTEHLILEANEDYWGGKPAYKKITFKVVPEVAARIAGLQAGDFHIITDVPPDLFSSLTSAPGIEVVGGAITTARSVVYNMHKPYMDVHLRKALTYAIDRELLVKTLWNGLVEVPNGIQWPVYGDMYIKEHPKAIYDVELAKKELAQSKYNGETLVYRVLKDYYTVELDTAQACVEMWKKIGVNVEIQVCENWSQVNATDANGIRTYDMRNTSHNGLFPDPVSGLWRTFKPSQDSTTKNNWKAPDFHEQGSILESATDPAVRRATFKKMLEIWDDNPPVALLYSNAIFFGKLKDVDWTPYGCQFMDFGPDNVKAK
ncbi:MAG: hypothetical protein J6W68_03570 [Spirochaetia bacterium]|nr:hypothetical protein [Spirochaetia bacterium]MBP5739961.1 hypothetical protein [Spirochaetia bacterium]